MAGFSSSSLHKFPQKKITKNNNYSITTKSNLLSFLSHGDCNGSAPNRTDSCHYHPFAIDFPLLNLMTPHLVTYLPPWTPCGLPQMLIKLLPILWLKLFCGFPLSLGWRPTCLAYKTLHDPDIALALPSSLSGLLSYFPTCHHALVTLWLCTGCASSRRLPTVLPQSPHRCIVSIIFLAHCTNHIIVSLFAVFVCCFD